MRLISSNRDIPPPTTQNLSFVSQDPGYPLPILASPAAAAAADTSLHLYSLMSA